MEEKERYVIRYDLDYNRCLIDTEKNQGVGDYIQIVKLLNQQDKRIKELEEENNFLEKRNEELMIDRRDICLERNDIFEENQQLKQQLAEKEKYIEEQEFAEYKEMFYATQELKEDCELKILELEKQCAKFKQLQNQTAIRELEKAKKKIGLRPVFVRNYGNGESEEIILEDVYIVLDQQIKELGGGENE